MEDREKDNAQGSRPALPRKSSPFKKGIIWLCTIALICLAIVGLGVHIGAHGEGQWYTEAVLWIVKMLESSEQTGQLISQ